MQHPTDQMGRLIRSVCFFFKNEFRSKLFVYLDVLLLFQLIQSKLVLMKQSELVIVIVVQFRTNSSKIKIQEFGSITVET